MFSSIVEQLNVELTEREAKAASFFENSLLKPNAKLKDIVLAQNLLSKADAGHIIRLSKNKALKTYFESNPTIQEKFKKSMIDAGCPDIEVYGRHPKERISVYNTYCGFYYQGLFGEAMMSENKNDDRSILLNKACSLGSFKALRMRCIINTEVLKRPGTSLSSQASEGRIAWILSDVKRLCNLFGAPGYIASGIILNNLGACFIPNDIKLIRSELKRELEVNATEAEEIEPESLVAEEKTPDNAKNEVDVLRGLDFYYEAIKCFLVAMLLQNDEYSNHLFLVITKGAGPAGLFHKDDPFDMSSWENAIRYIKSTMNEETFKTILSRAEKEREYYLSEESTPQVTTSATNGK